jgi:hypothetical protein
MVKAQECKDARAEIRGFVWSQGGNLCAESRERCLEEGKGCVLCCAIAARHRECWKWKQRSASGMMMIREKTAILSENTLGNLSLYPESIRDRLHRTHCPTRPWRFRQVSKPQRPRASRSGLPADSRACNNSLGRRRQGSARVF